MENITILGIDSLKAKLTNIAEAKAVEEAVNQATLLVHAQAKELAPVDTGALAGSIRPSVKRSGNEIVGKVFTNLSYAVYVEMGTGSKGSGTYDNPNVTPMYRDTPWVYTPDGGETFYRTEGQVAQPYMYPALKMNEKRIKAMIQEAIIKGGK